MEEDGTLSIYAPSGIQSGVLMIVNPIKLFLNKVRKTVGYISA